eukprot:972791-Amphidinium_carterae.1
MVGWHIGLQRWQRQTSLLSGPKEEQGSSVPRDPYDEREHQSAVVITKRSRKSNTALVGICQHPAILAGRPLKRITLARSVLD